MFKNIKYLELTRHHMLVKTKKLMDDTAKDEDNSFKKLSEVVFSSALSLFLTYLTKNFFVETTGQISNIKNFVLYFIVAIVLYCTLYVIIKILYSFIHSKIEKIKYDKALHSPEISAKKNKELIDDFDHIAFDNLMISYELIHQIESTSNMYIKDFYLHEAVYYLKTAISKTLDILHPDRREDCLNIFGNVNGIDIFRLINAYKMMDDIETNIDRIINDGTLKKDNISDIKIDESKIENIFYFQIKEIREKISYIEKACIKAIDELSPRN